MAEEDIFVHRTNLMGSAPGVHIDLQEGSKVGLWSLHGPFEEFRGSDGFTMVYIRVQDGSR